MTGARDFGGGVDAVTIASAELSATVLTLGGILQDVRLRGVDHSLTVAGSTAADYAGRMAYFGALVGPVANRIAGGGFHLNGRDHALDRNEGGETCLHGGATGLHARIWRIEDRTGDSVTLSTDLPDGLGGFPGNRRIAARFEVADTSLTLVITAETDAPSPINIANHAYWNLDGGAVATGHRLQVAADKVLELDAGKIPTGKRLDVAGTGVDFRAPRPVATVDAVPLDINFCLSEDRRALTEVAVLTGQSGVSLNLATTEPGLQVFDGHTLSGTGILSTNGHEVGRFAGIALEPQGWPDAVNQPGFPDIVLRPGARYRQETRWRFARGQAR